MRAQPTTGLRKLAPSTLAELSAGELRAEADRLQSEVDYWVEQVRQLDLELGEVA